MHDHSRKNTILNIGRDRSGLRNLPQGFAEKSQVAFTGRYSRRSRKATDFAGMGLTESALEFQFQSSAVIPLGNGPETPFRKLIITKETPG
jgi:hypothetical protein